MDAQAATRTEALTILRCKDWYTAFQFWQKFISEPRDHQLNLDDADLRGCSLANFFMPKISFRRANLAGVDFQHASLFGCDFTDGVLDNSTLHHANLSGAILRGATLLNADLRWAHLSGADCSNANISGSKVYGTSVWDVNLSRTIQQGLIITPDGEQTLSADNLGVAQFLNLMLQNHELRNAIDNISSKAVLLLGRFTEDHKPILARIRAIVAQRDLVPIIFDFDKPRNRDLTETVSILAHIARFIVVDITDARAVPQELERIVPDLPSVPVQPILKGHLPQFALFEHYTRYPWVLPIVKYDDIDDVRNVLDDAFFKRIETCRQRVLPPVSVEQDDARELPIARELDG